MSHVMFYGMLCFDFGVEIGGHLDTLGMQVGLPLSVGVRKCV